MKNKNKIILLLVVLTVFAALFFAVITLSPCKIDSECDSSFKSISEFREKYGESLYPSDDFPHPELAADIINQAEFDSGTRLDVYRKKHFMKNCFILVKYDRDTEAVLKIRSHTP
ncbi:MAG: hypothetical protein P8O22_12250 [Akkermansiaceae bacterium]|nr:hypothetical protein [Akkermansiaceae bacterium]